MHANMSLQDRNCGVRPDAALWWCRSWKIGKKGELEAGKAREKAHKDRVTALLAHAGFLYSASYDGAVKMWDADTMELVQDVKRAHEGGRINCATIGADGNLYTGGDDKVLTQHDTSFRWDPLQSPWQ